MTQKLTQDKQHALLKKMGKFIYEQRQKVFQESPDVFALRLNDIFPVDANASTVVQLESGDGSLPIHVWLCAWQLMQVADKVADASKSDIALFLASAQQFALSEREVLKNTPKG